MKKTWTDLPPHFVTSAEKRLGRDKLLSFIEEMNLDFLANKAEVSSE
jgi:GTP-binding protein